MQKMFACSGDLNLTDKNLLKQAGKMWGLVEQSIA